MADHVEQALQDMVPELDDLRRKRIFKDPEIRQIVRRRREFEYALQKMDHKPQDYLNYVRYEVALECLRRRRSLALHWRRRSLSDYAGVRRLVSIFDRCVSKFKADRRLWYQYVDFCLRSGSTKVLSGVLLRAVKFHPREVHFWLLAADRELRCGHVKAARTLLRRGLRCAPRSARLWGEFLRLELQVARRLLQAGAGAADGGATASPWAPARLLLRSGLRRLAGSPRACAALLAAAAGCVEQASPGAPLQGLAELAEEVRAAVAGHRPGAPGAPAWGEAGAAVAVQLWELWWTGERAARGDWSAVAEDVAGFAPLEAVRRCAAVLARAGAVQEDRSAQTALLAIARAPRAAADADTALALLEALEECSQSTASPDTVAASASLLQEAVKLHPSCTRLGILAQKQLLKGGRGKDPSGILALARGASNLEPAHAAQLLLLALRCSDEAPGDATVHGQHATLLEALLRALPPGASPRPLLGALFAQALAGGAGAPGAAALAAAAAARLWDAPPLRARLLAEALDAELRARPPPKAAEEAGRLCRRFEEVLGVLEGVGEARAVAEWWLRYREFAEGAARRGLGAQVPRSMDLHVRAMRSVVDQEYYSEQAHRRLQASLA